MRHVGFIAIGLIAIACGPDPNARLPGSATVNNNGGAVSSSGGDSSGGQGAGGVGAGGTTQSNGGASGGSGGKVGSGGAAGANPFDTGGAAGNGSGGGSGGGGGKVGSGGAAGANPFDTGGAAGKGNGGATSSGGVSAGGGSTSKGGSGGGGSSSSGWGVGPEPCSPAKDLSCSSGNGNTGNFDGTTFCFRTADKIAGWSCNNMDGWTMTINGKETACTSGTVSGSTLPPAINGIWYFQFTGSASSKTWASLSWYANTGDCKAGPYPAWGGSGSSTSTSVDGGG
jgi:hypothetical protein